MSPMVRTTGVALTVMLTAAPATALAADREHLQSTQLVSRSIYGGLPNGPSTNAVISGDRRYARVIAFESEASDLVHSDTNGVKDLFAIKRTGRIDNEGSKWRGMAATLVSRGHDGTPANGPSWAASVSGNFRHKGRCIAFLSGASNLVPGDTNNVVDAFLVKRAGRPAKRMTLPHGAEPVADATAVSVAGDCSRVSFVSGGQLYTRKGTKTKRVKAAGPVSNPSYAVGTTTSLVFQAPAGVYISRGGKRKAQLVAPGGANPVFNGIKRRTLAYEKHHDGYSQIFYKDLGRRETVISDRGRRTGNGNSYNPVIGNSGYYVTFQSEASNLGVNALGRTGDYNGRPDAYLFTDVRDLTLVQSVERKAVPLPGGGQNPSMSFYANYVLFDSPAPLGIGSRHHQVYMRYLGPV
jgi:hypothetical protein